MDTPKHRNENKLKNSYKGSYDELCAKGNETYRRTHDIREIVKETGIHFDVVWGMLGFKDWYGFYETGEEWTPLKLTNL